MRQNALVQHKRWWALAAVVVVLVAGAIGGWLRLSNRTADSVRVAWTAGSPRCSGTEIHHRASDAVIEAVRGMHCTITVGVVNDGPVGVHLDRGTAP